MKNLCSGGAERPSDACGAGVRGVHWGARPLDGPNPTAPMRSLLLCVGLALIGLFGLTSFQSSPAAQKGPAQKGPAQKAPVAQEKGQKPAAEAKEWQGEPYMLETCAASGRPIDVKGTPQTAFFNGRELKFCCGGCADFVKKSPDKFLAKVDEKLIAQQAPIYPTDKCIVAGTPLKKGDKDTGVDVMVGNRLFRVCCGKCAAKVKADPASFAGKLDALVLERAEKAYPFENCVVNEKRALGEKPKVFAIAGRPVKTCCSGCERKVRQEPLKYVSKIDAAVAEAMKKAAKDKKPAVEAKGKDGSKG